MLAYHPLQFARIPLVASRRPMLRGMGATIGTNVNPLGDIGQFIGNAVTGLATMVQNSIQAVVKIIGQVVQFIVDFTKAVFGQVPWKTVLGDLGKVFQDTANLLIILNPARFVSQLLLSSALTRHTFIELDHFLGGLITNLDNLSDVALRAIRGDSISKIELLKDALAALEVVAIIYGGPMAVGVILGTAVGQQVCQHQTMDQGVCNATFQILGAATGGYVGDAIDAMAEEEVPQDQSNLAVEDDIAQEPYSSYVSDATQTYLTKKLVEDSTRLAVILCQADAWAGPKECSLLGKIAADYVNSSEDQDFEDFVASEAAKLGVAALLADAFPPGTKAHQALINAIPKPIPSPYNPHPTTIVAGKKGATGPSGTFATILLIGAGVVGVTMLI